jgi:putative membrane protein
MKLGALIAALAGIALAAWLVFAVGFSGVAAAIRAAGWSGFALLVGYGLAMFLVLGLAWRALIAAGGGAGRYVWARMVRDSAGEVLPFSQFGGILLGARALSLHGLKAANAMASTTVDLTTEMMAQIAFIAMGLSVFVLRFGLAAKGLSAAILAGVAFVIAGSLAFIVLQRSGAALAERLATRFFPGGLRHAQAFRRALEAIYEHPTRLALSASLHLLAWIASAGATWLAIRLVGGTVDLSGAIVIESILCALRSAAIVVPAALGVQEAGYALMLPLFGLPAEMGLAISLLKRGREIVIGAPVLFAWQALEGRHAFKAETLGGAE